ncbi:hypothetical protein vseg_018364 [Gypsophila vaccaria]
MDFYHKDRNNFDEENKYVSSDESSSSYFEESNDSKGSSSSLDLLDDASSTSSSSSPSPSPLYGLSELMDQLPIKQGLSKFYKGKSQSFTTLARVTSIEDLAKKETPYQRRLKACKSFGGGLNNFKSYTHPKPTISKKVSKGSLSNISCLVGRKTSFTLGR